MIEVIASAAFNSVQDAGRAEMRRYGVARGGAMDLLALRLGNLMLGNDEHAAALEIQMAPVHLRFERDTTIALTGGDFGAELDGVKLPCWWSTPVRSGQSLKFTRQRGGARALLCVAGGIDVPPVLGSRSTMVIEKLGGVNGRFIMAGDALATFPASGTPSRIAFGITPPEKALLEPADGTDILLRYIRSDERQMFAEASLQRFEAESWTVSRLSNRMGFRLEGMPLDRVEDIEMRSHGILEGVIQVPPSGLPVVQLADGNSAGGYPKLGVICKSDLWRLVQCAPGAKIRFQPVDIHTAAEAAARIDAYIARLQQMLPLVPTAREG